MKELEMGGRGADLGTEGGGDGAGELLGAREDGSAGLRTEANLFGVGASLDLRLEAKVRRNRMNDRRIL